MAFAHTKNDAGERHSLVGHLRGVAELARAFGAAFGGEEAAYYAGLWHDLGKFHPEFQTYLEECEVKPGRARRGPPHSHVGAHLAANLGLDVIAFAIAGHHAGLPDKQDLKDRLADTRTPTSRNGRLASEALAAARAALDRLEPEAATDILPAWASEGDLFTRVLFSALVDADSLDTESHFAPETPGQRTRALSAADLVSRLEVDQEARSFDECAPAVKSMREQVWARCRNAADGPQGIYRLTVPTGGAKTRAYMRFALGHAAHHGLRRVIVAMPYTSIIDQTARVFRDALGEEAVLEHQTAAAWATRDDDERAAPDMDGQWQSLAAENWDAPVIVTTFVQLFESLFGNRRSDSRKLHNVARSVIVLDEVQTLPLGYTGPICDMLRSLVARLGVTVVLSSATLPAFGHEELGSDALPEAVELIPDYADLFRKEALRRVKYDVALDRPWNWDELAQAVKAESQCMVVLNTRRDALQVLDRLAGVEGVLHLSTLLCPEHRWDVLQEVNERLKAGSPCRLVATQVVEAGIDLDFPTVFRAIGPLDRIVQAAGRCNRNARSERGRVVVFEPEAGGMPERAGPYVDGTRAAKRILRALGPESLFEPDTFKAYFRAVFQAGVVDTKGIQAYRKSFDFREVARRFRLIEEDEEQAVVPYRRGEQRIGELLERARLNRDNPRKLIRALQRYSVGIGKSALSGYQARGLIVPVRPGLWRWNGGYSELAGIGSGAEAQTWVI